MCSPASNKNPGCARFNRQCAQQRPRIGRMPAAIAPPAACSQPGTSNGNQLALLENLVQMAAGPSRYKQTSQNAKERHKTEPRLRRPLPANRNPGTPGKKSSGGFASEHREHNVIGYRLRLAQRVAQVWRRAGSIFCTEVCIISRTEPGALSSAHVRTRCRRHPVQKLARSTANVRRRIFPPASPTSPRSPASAVQTLSSGS